MRSDERDERTIAGQSTHQVAIDYQEIVFHNNNSFYNFRDNSNSLKPASSVCFYFNFVTSCSLTLQQFVLSSCIVMARNSLVIHNEVSRDGG